MYIETKDLEKKNCLWSSTNSYGYDLGNGLIAKRFRTTNKELLDLNMQKVVLGNQFQWINGLVVPEDFLQTEEGYVGYIQQKKDGNPFSIYYNFCLDGPELSKIVDYILKLEDILKKCHQEEKVFPDLASGNVLYNAQNGDVNIIDYNGAQVRNLPTSDISDIVFRPFAYLINSPKYSVNGIYNKNMDIFTLITRFFYYVTKVEIGRAIVSGVTLDDLIDLANLHGTNFAYILKNAFNSNTDNPYIGDALKELNDNYVLSKKMSGEPRRFIKK